MHCTANDPYAKADLSPGLLVTVGVEYPGLVTSFRNQGEAHLYRYRRAPRCIHYPAYLPCKYKYSL